MGASTFPLRRLDPGLLLAMEERAVVGEGGLLHGSLSLCPPIRVPRSGPHAGRGSDWSSVLLATQMGAAFGSEGETSVWIQKGKHPRSRERLRCRFATPASYIRAVFEFRVLCFD